MKTSSGSRRTFFRREGRTAWCHRPFSAPLAPSSEVGFFCLLFLFVVCLSQSSLFSFASLLSIFHFNILSILLSPSSIISSSLSFNVLQTLHFSFHVIFPILFHLFSFVSLSL